ncbi:GTP-binding protein [Thermus caliditerrae]|uniref:GTP-binding protein n=1 Tax=Thermus caliditerrae TaxID=1330700 RepID=UPI001F18CBBB|nr:ATP/GTP-binding protein [Thermus caliditerrae]
MEPLKILVAGPVGAGKTAFARSLLGEEALTTEAKASEDLGKETTTVAMDFGVMAVGPYRVHLFGAPGQARFDFMWDVLAEGALGLLLLLAGDKPEHLPEARHLLDYLLSRHPIPHLVGVTRLDLGRAWEPEEVALYLRLPPERVVGLDARKRADAFAVLTRLVEMAVEVRDA